MRLWLCDARKCSIISTIVKLLAPQSVLLRKLARMRVVMSATAGILSALAPLLIMETQKEPFRQNTPKTLKYFFF